MQGFLPYFFLILTIIAFFLNILGFMKIIPIYVSLPALFISIYLTIFSFTHKRVFRGMR